MNELPDDSLLSNINKSKNFHYHEKGIEINENPLNLAELIKLQEENSR